MKTFASMTGRPQAAGVTAALRCATRAGLPAAFALSLAALLASTPAPAQTVSCAEAQKPAEFAICNSEDLQLLDEKVDAAYRREMAALGTKPGQQQATRRQAQWELGRDACKADAGCLQRAYEARLSELSGNTAANSGAPISSFRRFSGNGG